MDAKKVATVVGALMLLVLSVDFSQRLLVGVEIEHKSSEQQGDAQAPNVQATLLSVEEMKTLLAWSDIEPTPQEIAQQKAKEQQAQQAATPPPPPPPAPKVDVHAQVQQAIVGDDSKRLLGDNLITLRGVFFDREHFAVMEVENILSKSKQYYRAKLNETVDGHLLVDIGKNFVSIQNGDQHIRLQMFEGTL